MFQRLFHSLGDALADGGIQEPLLQLLLPAVQRPTRQQNIEAGGGAGVGILIRGDIHTLASGRGNEGDHLIARAPEILAADFQM